MTNMVVRRVKKLIAWGMALAVLALLGLGLLAVLGGLSV